MSEFELEYTLDEKEPPDPDEGGYEAYVWERTFFNGFLMRYGTIGQAAKEAGVTEEIVELRAKAEPVFAKRIEICRKQLREDVDREILRRALEPSREPIIFRGKIIAYKEIWDSAHLRWVAERLSPSKYHLPTIVGEGQGDGELNFRLELNPKEDKEIEG